MTKPLWPFFIKHKRRKPYVAVPRKNYRHRRRELRHRRDAREAIRPGGGAVVASANKSACETVAADIVKAGGKALAVIADVTKKGMWAYNDEV